MITDLVLIIFFGNSLQLLERALISVCKGLNWNLNGFRVKY